MRRALTNVVYRRLFLAQLISLAGTGMATVALGLMAFQLAGAAAGTVLGTALAVKMIAYVVVAPLAQALVARLPRRAVMIGADLVRLLVAVSLPGVDQTWQVYLLVFALQAGSATFTPTFQSVIPDVLTQEEDYTAALSLSRLAYDLEAVVSPVLAAAALLLIPGHALFFGTAAGFAASAAVILATRIPGRRSVADGPDAPFGRRLRGGVVLFVGTPALRPILAINLAVAAAGAFVLVQTVVIAQSSVRLGESAVALLLAVNGAGSILAALLLPRLLTRWSERRIMLGAATGLSLATAATAAALTLDAAAAVVGVVVLWFVIGFGWSAAETPVGRLIRRHVASDGLPSALAAQFSMSHACWLITYPLAGWLGAWDLAGAAVVLAVIAGGSTLIAARTWLSPDPHRSRAPRSIPPTRASRRPAPATDRSSTG